MGLSAPREYIRRRTDDSPISDAIWPTFLTVASPSTTPTSRRSKKFCALFERIMAAGEPNTPFAWAQPFFLFGAWRPPGCLVGDVMSSLPKRSV